MPYTYAVLGAGRQGTAAVYDMARWGDARGVILADYDLEVARRLRGCDAIYAALARREGVPLVTWDHQQRSRAAPVVEALTPSEALAALEQ
ncbi:MAG: hypothetical protein ACETWR_10755 [Anaerolineae bacterium]